MGEGTIKQNWVVSLQLCDHNWDMPGRAKCQPGCACEKHNRPRMSLDEQEESQRRRSRAYYEAHREEVLERQRQKRRDPVAGQDLRARERERIANLSAAEREERAQQNRDWYRQNPRSSAENARQHMRFRYGLSPEQRAQMLDDQDGRCYLCGEPLDLDQPRKVHVDHDHSCCRGGRSCGACIRGLACDPCNRGIGYFRDDTDRMRRVADALEAANAKVAARKATGPQQGVLPIDIRHGTSVTVSGLRVTPGSAQPAAAHILAGPAG